MDIIQAAKHHQHIMLKQRNPTYLLAGYNIIKLTNNIINVSLVASITLQQKLFAEVIVRSCHDFFLYLFHNA